MEEELANLNLIDEEEDAFHEEGAVVDQKYQFSLFHAIDVQIVLFGTTWFFNNHLLILHKIQSGGNPLLVSLSLSEFWVQKHDLPPGLMTETMAKQFGDFLGQFLEYDTTILTMGIQKFMRIQIRLDVTIPLKRNKKILIGKDQIFRTRIEPSKIVFKWDISLRARVRRQNATVSKWLREADGSECRMMNMTLFRVEKSKGQEIAFWPPWTAEPWPNSGKRGESLKDAKRRRFDANSRATQPA
ncbi:hypothetical protein Goarm_020690, partial [Gossypium armourianum]|nr:hypothetical protein [Gossypium armourianum]